ncbi:MAG: PepSY domain-containing protein [Alphaproteobacteria bacterium]
MRTIEARETANRGQLYRILWRWHFYAGLVCIPFVIWLACTGTVYLFRPQIEAWIDRDLVQLVRTGQPATADAVVKAAIAAVPDSKLAAIVLPEHPDQAARVLVSAHGSRTRVYVHPDSFAILKTASEDNSFDRIVAKLHGELLIGKTGSVIVELAASWAIVMVLTGLYLWWPRRARGLAGVLWPRLGEGAQRFWRDLHAVTGVWVSVFALFLLVSGLPWAFAWGGALKQVRKWAEPTPISQDWPTSSAGEHAERMHMDAMTMPLVPQDASIDLIVQRAEALNLASPVLLTPPSKGAHEWWAKSNAQNRPKRDNVALAASTGDVVTRQEFQDRPLIDRIVGTTTAIHEGQLFAPLNQVLGVLTALGIITLSASAFVLWRRRAPKGVLGAPPPIPDGKLGVGLASLIVIMAVLLPVLGCCLVVIAIVERLILARWTSAQRWLGLRLT